MQIADKTDSAADQCDPHAQDKKPLPTKYFNKGVIEGKLLAFNSCMSPLKNILHEEGTLDQSTISHSPKSLLSLDPERHTVKFNRESLHGDEAETLELRVTSTTSGVEVKSTTQQSPCGSEHLSSSQAYSNQVTIPEEEIPGSFINDISAEITRETSVTITAPRLKRTKSLNYENKEGEAKRQARLHEFSNISDFPETLRETILEFKGVLDDDFSVQNNDSCTQLNQEVQELKLIIRERDKAWEEKLAATLKKEKTFVVDSFKKMLNELKRMCHWQRNGDSIILNQPVFVPEKKLFSSQPFQHEFKSSMEEIRNTLMELKILNSESQTLREALQNLRRTLEEEREIKENCEEELESIRAINKGLAKEQADCKRREEEYKNKILTLEQEVRNLKHQTQQHMPDENQEGSELFSRVDTDHSNIAQTEIPSDIKIEKRLQDAQRQKYRLEGLVHSYRHRLLAHENTQLSFVKEQDHLPISAASVIISRSSYRPHDNKQKTLIRKTQSPMAFKQSAKKHLNRLEQFKREVKQQMTAALH